jgi:hypothetical protein
MSTAQFQNIRSWNQFHHPQASEKIKQAQMRDRIFYYLENTGGPVSAAKILRSPRPASVRPMSWLNGE